MKCPYCGYENSEDARFCNLCQHSFVKEPSASYGLDPLQGSRPEPSQKAKKAVENVLSQPKGLNWFQRHLNWTWFFAQLVVGLITYVLVTVLVTSLIASGPNFPSESSLLASASVMQIVTMLLQLAAMFGVGAWVLKRKGRSLGWLLIFLVPLVGWIIFLCLENRNLLEELPVSAGPSSYEPSRSSIQPGLAPYGLGSKPDRYGP